jgi:glycine cleavage system T protein (aminomethyltransferase)
MLTHNGMNRTALYEVHRQLGGKMVEFAGWEMPAEYLGIRDEHLAVRNSAGLFDVSHMGEVEVRGREAASLCQWVTTNDVTNLKNLQAEYTLLCNPQGGVIDDIIVYKFSDDHFFICVNAVNTIKDYQWIKEAGSGFKAEVLNRSLEFSQIAFQGSNSGRILNDVFRMNLETLKRFFCQPVQWNGADLVVARTGYTGEDGFEIFLPWDRAKELWDDIMEKGKPFGILPCGLGARDTLRIEMAYPLYGHEIDEYINPIEAGLTKFVKIGKGEFIGKESLVNSIEKGLGRKLAGFEMVERGIPRQGYRIFKDNDVLGAVTSGTLSPSLQKSIAMGYLKSGVESSDEVEIEIRGTRRRAKIVPVPFYRKLKKERKNGRDS